MHQDGVTVGCGLRHKRSPGGAARARAIFHYDRPPDLTRELVEHDPADHVLGVAGRQRDDGVDVLRWPGLRERRVGRRGRGRYCEAKQFKCPPDGRDYHRIRPSLSRAVFIAPTCVRPETSLCHYETALRRPRSEPTEEPKRGGIAA